ncbi:glycosyltransferase [Marinobacter piscensis]|uniref:glycosyltransferase n=1 Tax=Marinobacter piscensis TaxID=1562308 RepID=UPI00119E6F0D|nr:glycosyltransferase [Marinobacter piscensis]
MDTIKVSVIIPFYNEEQFIGQCLSALEAQDYPRELFEVIAVDNNSTDKSTEIAKQFNVNVINQPIGTVGAVRNAGAKSARGQYLAFIDADCIVQPNWLSLAVNAMETENATYGGGYSIRNSPYWIEKAWLLEPRVLPKELLGGCIFIKKTVFFDISGFDETITSGEDTKLSQTLRENNYDVKIISDLNIIHLGNPVTLKHFFYRQVWHSENYFQNWPDTIKDPTFYLLLMFILSTTSFIACVLSRSSALALIFLTITLIIPTALTAKRLLRSENALENITYLPAIYFLDLVYLVGRTAGLAKSLSRAVLGSLLSSPNHQ